MAQILMVENEHQCAATAEVSCKAGGHELAVVRHGTQAMVRLASRPFDVVLIDARMPGKEGLALIQDLRRHPAYKHLPVLALSSKADEDAHRLLAVGADRVLPNPCPPEVLQLAIRDVAATRP